jgi:hypothetical protein
MDEYVFQEYPKWVYLGDKAVLVDNIDQELALTGQETKESIMALLDKQGATYDKRWGMEKLKAALK